MPGATVVQPVYQDMDNVDLIDIVTTIYGD